MIMDALVLIVFAISIFWSMREGLALAVAGLIKGIAAVAAAWIFCDDLAVVLLKIPSVHDFAVGKISENLSVRWENSAVYEALPKLSPQTTVILPTHSSPKVRLSLHGCF